ncbi:MAG: dehydrogenase [Bacteroidetes bacterium]|jgi:D-glycero-alpha-D-manno-heptose-7-phosphate kinase|nr:dehydrogenase [Bacteroidota bacterium]
MIIKSKAPLRLGLAGGGTDVSPYSDLHGGAILNATISSYAYAVLEPTNDGKIEFITGSSGMRYSFTADNYIPFDNRDYELQAGVYNRIVREFTKQHLSFRLTTWIEAPQGSGLGTSSTLMVAILGAFKEWLQLPLGQYDIAHMAFEIERIEMKMAGGKQDQYAATFGGVNYLEFFGNDKVIVNPLSIKQDVLNELEMNLLLYFTETRRDSAQIITHQVENVKKNNMEAIEAMHKLKEQAQLMKECLLRGNVDEIGTILNLGWLNKKKMASAITNDQLDNIYEAALHAGATGGKISGAGGGGFMFFYCPGTTKLKVDETLRAFGGSTKSFTFTSQGLTTWTINH